MLLMIPGPIEISPTVQEAYSVAPPSHLAPHVIEAFGKSLELMREFWCAGADAQPFVVAGSGTLAMEMAAANVVDPGEHVLVVNTGYFSDRMAEMLRRRGAVITEVAAELGDAPGEERSCFRGASSGGGIKLCKASRIASASSSTSIQ